jgi:hypothetical protein
MQNPKRIQTAAEDAVLLIIAAGIVAFLWVAPWLF